MGVLLSGLDSTPDRCTFRPIPQSAWLRIPLYLRRGSLSSPRLLRDSRHAGPGLFRHNRLTSHEGGLTEALTHVQSSVGLHSGHEGVDLPVARVTSNFTEVAVLTQVHQEGRIANAAIEAVLESRGVHPRMLRFSSATGRVHHELEHRRLSMKHIPFDLLEELTETLSDSEIAEKLGVARVTVTDKRKRLGIKSLFEKTGLKKRDNSLYLGGRPREITFDEDYFESITSKEQAYYLGLLLADGSVSKDLNHVEISLSDPDFVLLEGFKTSIKAHKANLQDKKVRGNQKPAKRLTLCSKKLAKSLINWGMTPARTYSWDLQREIPKKFLADFVRGYWDGDGSVGETFFSIAVCAPEFAKTLKGQLTALNEGVPPLERTFATKNMTLMYEFSIRSPQHKVVRDKLYEDPSPCLSRKYEEYLKHWC